jgi:L-serine dehydratase
LPTGVFDIIGPIMIGPSSSHTAGACRLGRLFRSLCGGTPKKVRFGLHGSFARTGSGHGTDLALIAGILGLREDDPKLRNARELAEEEGVEVAFYQVDLGEDIHPNSVEITTENHRMIGSSIGGGCAVISTIDLYQVQIDGSLPTLFLIWRDSPGVLATVTGVLAEAGCNIATVRLSRKEKHGEAGATIELDGLLPDNIDRKLATLPEVSEVRIIEALDD